MLSQELPSVFATQFSDWGLPVPVQEFASQKISAWFELGPHYLGVTADMCKSGHAPGEWKDFWAKQNSEVVQFFGFDSCYFHSLLFPAIFYAYDALIRPPKIFISNEFCKLDGKKFSTSRNHAIWGGDILKRYQSDLVRYYVAYIRPECEQTNFTISEFEEFIQKEFRLCWDGWLGEMQQRMQEEFHGVVPEFGNLSRSHQAFRDRVEFLASAAWRSFRAKSFSLQAATRNIIEMVRESRRFGKLQANYAGIKTRNLDRSTAINLELAAAGALAIVSAPLMPTFAFNLWRDLGMVVDLQKTTWDGRLIMIPKATTINLTRHPYFALL
jgi:methionyl-tRNA synthetase